MKRKTNEHDVLEQKKSKLNDYIEQFNVVGSRIIGGIQNGRTNKSYSKTCKDSCNI